MQNFICTGTAKSTFKAANYRIFRLRWQISITAFAVRAQLEHGVLLMVFDWSYHTLDPSLLAWPIVPKKWQKQTCQYWRNEWMFHRGFWFSMVIVRA
ncbi:hypothetical protein GCM10009007_15290 [Formosimonas limnophila]|uniref:Uncharacterized protein n=1 Tax=Formosimonas limnophila TaxID=1384487 RepID=A0A8J3CNX3_9BURK|nr:hypothetical protein GCM10009007_15290 [Formosimonas limnophila]